MLYRSINVAILVLLSWFSFVSMQATQRQNETIQHTQTLLSKSHQMLLETQQDQQQKVASLQESLDNFLAAQKTQANEKKKLQASVSAQKQKTSLYELYGQVLKADVLRGSGQFPEAVTLLKSTKKGIWQAGDRYPKHQKALRASMQTIDGLMKSWTAKEASQTAAPIYKALEKVLLDTKGQS